MVNVLAKKAVLAQLFMFRWGARRFDNSVTDEVLDKHFAKKDSGLFTKRLLARSAMAKIHTISRGARAYHISRTQPWFDDGIRILPTTLYFDYSKTMGKFKDDFYQAVADFVADYPRFIDEAKAELGSLFNPEDYPKVRTIADRFSFEVVYTPCPDSQDFRAELDPDHLADIKATLDQRMDSQFQAALADTGARIAETIGKLAERLKAYKPADSKTGKKVEGRFHDSLIEHVRELAELLPAFNLNDDPELAKITARIKTDLGTFEAEDLRTDAKLRKRVAKSADQILKDVSDFLS